MVTRIFIHGLESSNQGTKSVYFRKRYPDMIIPHFQGALEARMRELDGVLAGKEGIRIVGSSFGGLMAAIFARENAVRIERMVLLAPALNLMAPRLDTRAGISVPVWIYHGSEDEVLPLAEVKSVANEIFLQLSFHVVQDDHYLHKTFKSIDWDFLLS